MVTWNPQQFGSAERCFMLFGAIRLRQMINEFGMQSNLDKLYCIFYDYEKNFDAIWTDLGRCIWNPS
ncbi:hypothetical protein AGMMS50239_32070 [Bacteroidia bacterium]|nr:hypothetical protein AGMMS50239_32070 [Bacteroidia bacterium]